MTPPAGSRIVAIPGLQASMVIDASGTPVGFWDQGGYTFFPRMSEDGLSLVSGDGTALIPLGTELNVKNYGAVGDGTTDDTAAFLLVTAAMEAAATRATLVAAGVSDLGGTLKVVIPAGRYLITSKQILIRSSFNSKRLNVVLEGDGASLTEILYNPSALDGATPQTPMFTNDAWLNMRFSGIRFACHSSAAGATFMHSNSIQNQQDYTFTDCAWSGSWGNAFYLTGTNNNSEFRFNSSAAYGFKLKPFLESVDSDQFLNYWFDKFMYWSAHAPLVKMTKGGHVHFRSVDVSDFGNGLGVSGALNEVYLVQLIGASHSRGVCHFLVDGLRVEAKSTNAKLLYSEWPQGVISMRGVDYTSQTAAVSNATTFTADSTTDIITHAGLDYPTGTQVQLTNAGGGLPAGLSLATDYYTVRQSATTSKLAATLALALAASPTTIDFTTNGTGTHTMTSTKYGALVYLSYVNVTGPAISIRDSEMCGKIAVSYGSNNWDYEGVVLVDNCQWLENERPSDVVVYVGATNSGGRPNVKFRNCTASYAYTSGHKAAWEYDSAAKTAMATNIAEKIFIVHETNTTILPSTSIRVILPLGSIITRFRGISKTGNGEAGAVTYSLKTTEGSPATVGQVTWTNINTNTGYAETLTVPYFCDAADTATLTVSAEADVASNNGNLSFLIYYI